MPAHKCLHATCHTPLHLDGRSFDGKQMQKRMRAFCVLLRVLFVCTKTCLLKLRPRLPHIMCVEGHSLADMSRYKHVFLNHCTTVQHAEPCQPAALHEVPYQSMSGYVVTWRSRTSVCQCSGVQHARKKWEASPGYASRLSAQPLVRSVSGSSGCSKRAFSENI